MNERADELADKGKTADQPELCPDPQKHGSFWLRIKPTVRTQAAEYKFREPRTSAHNQVWRVITAFLARNIGHGWKMFEEMSLKSTGLVLRTVSATSVASSQSQETAHCRSEQ